VKCPKCSVDLLPWGYDGYSGVRCCGCDTKWWSASLVRKFGEAERRVLDIVLATSNFPDDAVQALPNGDHPDRRQLRFRFNV
jgi:hypothetical protein